MTRWWLLAVLASCSSSSSSTCTTSQVEVTYLGGGARNGETTCEPIPASCGSAAACDVQACIHDMYGYCESPYIGVGCSDTFPPTIISCNP